MAIRALLVGLTPAEGQAIHVALDRMRIHAEAYGTPAQAKGALPKGHYDLAIIGYEGEGCGLPFAMSLRPQGDGASAFDCIVVADQACPALEKAAVDMGLLAVLVRPVRPKALAAAIETHIARRMAWRDTAAQAKAIA